MPLTAEFFKKAHESKSSATTSATETKQAGLTSLFQDVRPLLNVTDEMKDFPVHYNTCIYLGIRYPYLSPEQQLAAGDYLKNQLLSDDVSIRTHISAPAFTALAKNFEHLDENIRTFFIDNILKWLKYSEIRSVMHKTLASFFAKLPDSTRSQVVNLIHDVLIKPKSWSSPDWSYSLVTATLFEFITPGMREKLLELLKATFTNPHAYHSYSLPEFYKVLYKQLNYELQVSLLTHLMDMLTHRADRRMEACEILLTIFRQLKKDEQFAITRCLLLCVDKHYKEKGRIVVAHTYNQFTPDQQSELSELLKQDHNDQTKTPGALTSAGLFCGQNSLPKIIIHTSNLATHCAILPTSLGTMTAHDKHEVIQDLQSACIDTYFLSINVINIVAEVFWDADSACQEFFIEKLAAALKYKNLGELAYELLITIFEKFGKNYRDQYYPVIAKAIKNLPVSDALLGAGLLQAIKHADAREQMLAECISSHSLDLIRITAGYAGMRP